MAVLALVRRALEAQTARLQGASPPTAGAKKARKELSQAKAALPGPAALDVLCEMFHLSPFERDVTLMCAGMELDASFPSLCAAASGDPGRNYPTLSLALTVFPEPHWSALTPAAPLRHWRLIELGSGESLTVSTLRLDERILHYLTGIQHLMSDWWALSTLLSRWTNSFRPSKNWPNVSSPRGPRGPRGVYCSYVVATERTSFPSQQQPAACWVCNYARYPPRRFLPLRVNWMHGCDCGSGRRPLVGGRCYWTVGPRAEVMPPAATQWSG